MGLVEDVADSGDLTDGVWDNWAATVVSVIAERADRVAANTALAVDVLWAVNGLTGRAALAMLDGGDGQLSAGDVGHAILDVAGLIPVAGEPADAVNAVWYAAEGDYTNAGLSAAAMVPIGGWCATGGKLVTKGAKGLDDAADAAPRSPVAPQGGLRRHDNAGGHTLDPDKAHVGASDEQLLDRLAKTGNRGSSSYYDRAAAERAVSENITGNADEIQHWLESGKQSRGFRWQHDQPVGRHAPRGASGADDVSDVSGSWVVLVRDSSMPEGYRIQTTFPRP